MFSMLRCQRNYHSPNDKRPSNQMPERFAIFCKNHLESIANGDLSIAILILSPVKYR